MASGTTLSAKNLAALGAERLAELLLEVTAGDAAARRQVRLELASRGNGDVAGEIRKRLVSIARSRSFVDWHKVKTLARDLEVQREAIAAHVTPTNPGDAFDLLWRLLEMAPSIYERCDDSNGVIGSVIASARDDLGAVAAKAEQPEAALADRVFAAVCANDYGQFDGLIPLTAQALGPDGLGNLAAKFEALAADGPEVAPSGERRVIGLSTRGPMYEDEYERSRHARLIRSALTDIADALGDVDGFAGRYSDEERANPAIAAAIAERMLAANRAGEALAVLDRAAGAFHQGGHWPDWQRVRIDVLDALGRSGEAQAERWRMFERNLDVGYVRAYIKQLLDFDDIEAEERALGFASRYASFHQALAFLMEWPAHDRAAGLVMARTDELDGNHYWLLTPSGDALEQRHPLAANLLVLVAGTTNLVERAMVEIVDDNTLDPNAKIAFGAGGHAFDLFFNAVSPSGPMTDTFLDATIKDYVRQCYPVARVSPAYPVDDDSLFRTTTDLPTAFAGMAGPATFSTVFTAADKGGTTVSCDEAWDHMPAPM